MRYVSEEEPSEASPKIPFDSARDAIRYPISPRATIASERIDAG
jgi:hypothetical protein